MLEARSIRKSFSGVQALKGVSFDLRAGEVHALVGENGAGKSTLVKIITGAVEPDAGELEIFGVAHAGLSPASARALGIAAIYQQPALFPDLTVAENIALALENGGLWRRVDWKTRREQARRLLRQVGSSLDPERIAASLSMPEQQILEIAKAVGADAKIVIMDEPTAALSEREVEHLFAIIRDLRARGVGIIYISHRLEEIASIADRITVLRDGEAAGTFAAGEIDRERLIEKMAGRPLAQVFPKRAVALGEVALEIPELGLSVRRGEIVGLGGLAGAGRTELAESIFGLRPDDPSEIRVHGVALRITSPRQAIANGIAYLPEDRRRHGVILDLPIYSNVSLASLDRVSKFGWIRRDRETSIAEKWIAQLRVRTPSANAATGDLSGGNQQKVALARWLENAPHVLILDEPTQGVDVGAKSEIHSLMMDLAERGVAILMISSELPEILGMSDRIAVMRAGAIAGILARAEATQEKILGLALGHAA